MPEGLLTTAELCERLQVGRTTVWRWRKEGMPFIKYGNSVRFDWTEVITWLKSKEQK